MTQRSENRGRLVTNPAACIVVGIVGALICVAGALWRPDAFWPAWLAGWMFWLTVPLGAIGILLIHRLTGGRWGYALDREATAVLQTLPLPAVLFLPLLFGARWLYPWLGEDTHLNQHQEIYLNFTNWMIRAAIYFAIWLGGMFFVNSTRSRRIKNPEGSGAPRMAAIGLVLFFAATTFASFDWLMSLTPEWSSTIYGAITVVTCAVTGMSATIMLCRWSLLNANREPFAPQGWQDLGNWLQTFNLLWVYFSFSQFLIIWSGDLPQEVIWYVQRSGPYATGTSIFLVLFHFVIPFGALLSLDIKQHPNRLAGVARLLFLVCLIESAWLVWPAFSDAPPFLLVLFLAATVCAIGGFWLPLASWRWSALPADPRSLTAYPVDTMATTVEEPAT